MPEKVIIKISGNVLKNVKSVLVPNTNGLFGVDSACVVGIVGGKPELELEVLEKLTAEDIDLAKKLLSENYCAVEPLESSEPLHIIVYGYLGDGEVSVELKGGHSNITKIVKNGEVIFSKPDIVTPEDKFDCTLEEIYEFARNVKLEDVEALIDKEIEYNTAISIEGLTNKYGQNIGKTLIDVYGTDAKITTRALAAAGSDARMSGCSMPVVINSGSGNQGLTVTMPVVAFSKELGCTHEQTVRALVLSNLVAIHLKRNMGKLSAFCGVVSASCGAGAGITYLHNGTFNNICDTVTNTIANISGIICDGAKGSCAAKIASSVDACILAHYMSMSGRVFRDGEGIVKGDIETTLDGVTHIGKDAMRQTDEEILKIMFDKYKKN